MKRTAIVRLRPFAALLAMLATAAACERRPSSASCQELAATVSERLARGGTCQIASDCVFCPLLQAPGEMGTPSNKLGTATDRSTAREVSGIASDYAAKGCGAVLEARRDHGQELLPDCVDQTCRLRSVSGY